MKSLFILVISFLSLNSYSSQNDGQSIVNKFKAYQYTGAIVLMHDYDFGKSEEMQVALDKMILYGKSQGYTFVTIENIEK
jgi:peptidoglycan/xylan/chitin deacetylase (PgdA/CDA1 family)